MTWTGRRVRWAVYTAGGTLDARGCVPVEQGQVLFYACSLSSLKWTRVYSNSAAPTSHSASTLASAHVLYSLWLRPHAISVCSTRTNRPARKRRFEPLHWNVPNMSAACFIKMQHTVVQYKSLAWLPVSLATCQLAVLDYEKNQ